VTTVIDASAVAAVIFAEAGGEAVAERIIGAPLAAPALVEFELANVCVSKCRRAPSERDALVASLALRNRLDIELCAVDIDGVTALALETGLTAYDASYLWLARHLGAGLVTLDGALAQAFAAV